MSAHDHMACYVYIAHEGGAIWPAFVMIYAIAKLYVRREKLICLIVF